MLFILKTKIEKIRINESDKESIKWRKQNFYSEKAVEGMYPHYIIEYTYPYVTYLVPFIAVNSVITLWIFLKNKSDKAD